MSGWTRPPTWWDKVKCFFGYHLWLEEWPDDWPMAEIDRWYALPPHVVKIPRQETKEDMKKKGWTRKCIYCGKVQKREEWK